MPNQNIFQQRVRPVLPRILQEERVFVYVPKASSSKAGIAYFPDEEFTVAGDGKVTLKWPMSLQVQNEKYNDPLKVMARAKFLTDEFVHTNEPVTITSPDGKYKYTSTKSELKLNRIARDPSQRPDLIMIDTDTDFEKEDVQTPDGIHFKYRLKRNNPLDVPALVKLNNQDFAYDEEATIRWPYAHNTAIGTDRTNGYGLMKIRPNSEDYLKYDNDYLAIDKDKLFDDITALPTYGGKDNGFEDYNTYVNEDGTAKRDATGKILLKLTKDAIGLSKVANKSFEEYVYDDFGTDMKKHFTDWFNTKLDEDTWNKLFENWNEPVGTQVQDVINQLREEDASLYDAIRANKAFLGFYEDELDLINVYPASALLYGSTAYVRSTKSYWRVRATNVNKIVDHVPTKSDVPDDAKNSTTYRVGQRDTQQVYQWDGAKFNLTSDKLEWVDTVVPNAEDMSAIIEQLKDHGHLVEGYKIGCIEANQTYIYTNGAFIDNGPMYYEWADTYIATLSWNTFIETDPSVLKPDGVANVGTSGKWVSSDHVHPTDTTRLAKTVFDNTKISVDSNFTNNATTDFTVSLQDGGDKRVNIPYVRMSKAIHNYNGQTEFIDNEDSESYYWAGTADEFEAQKENAKPGTFFLVDDGEDFIVADFLGKADLDGAGITLNPGISPERFVITSVNDIAKLKGSLLTLQEITGASGTKRYKLVSVLPDTVSDGQVIVADTTNTNPSVRAKVFSAKKLIVTDDLGALTEGPDIDNVIQKDANLVANQLVIGNGTKSVRPLNIDNSDGGIVVANGSGAIRSQAFGEAGYLLETDGQNGNILSAKIATNTLVRANANEFDGHSGIVISDGVGGVERQELGETEGLLVVTDGANGLKEKAFTPGSLLRINTAGAIEELGTNASDNGKALIVVNGSLAVASLPSAPTVLPVRTNTIPYSLSFGQVEASAMVEGVLYLW